MCHPHQLFQLVVRNYLADVLSRVNSLHQIYFCKDSGFILCPVFFPVAGKDVSDSEQGSIIQKLCFPGEAVQIIM